LAPDGAATRAASRSAQAIGAAQAISATQATSARAAAADCASFTAGPTQITVQRQEIVPETPTACDEYGDQREREPAARHGC
jgi:hypothetical protein